MLKREKIPHAVLNAKYHLQEAEIVRARGQAGSVTISTNMAGRGTDIKLGRRRGGRRRACTSSARSATNRAASTGSCAAVARARAIRAVRGFYVSFEDDLMRNFGAADRMTKMMERFGLEEGQELEHPWLNKSVETAQKRVEQRNYLIRKRTLEFDDVMNKQREVVYGFRNEAIDTEDPRKLIYEVIEEAVPAKVREHLVRRRRASRTTARSLNWVNVTFPLGPDGGEGAVRDAHASTRTSQFLIEKIKETYELKSIARGADAR